NIAARLDARLSAGLVEEVRSLSESGLSHRRLQEFGLEYKYVSLFLQGAFGFEEMRDRLYIAIRQFARRQMTWFRKMEREGVKIHWTDRALVTPETESLIENAINLRDSSA